MTEITMSDLFSLETLRDPVALYWRLREQEPLSHFTVGTVGSWIIATSYAESIELLQRLPDLRLGCEPAQLISNPVEKWRFRGTPPCPRQGAAAPWNPAIYHSSDGFDMSWNPVPYLRGLKALPVTFEVR